MQDKRNLIGAGPSGLTAAYLLCKRGMDVGALEADPQYVGGLKLWAVKF